MYSILETNKNEMVSFDPGNSQVYKALHSPCPLLGSNIHNCTHSQYLLSAQILERNKGRRADRWVEDHLSLTHLSFQLYLGYAIRKNMSFCEGANISIRKVHK